MAKKLLKKIKIFKRSSKGSSITVPRTVASDDVKANPKLSSNNDNVVKDSVPITAVRTKADSNAIAIAACPEVIHESSTTDSATLDVTLDTESSDEEAVVVASTIEPACAESTFKDELPNLSGNVDEEEVLEEDTDEATYEEKEKSTSDVGQEEVEETKVLLNNEAIEDTFNEAPKSDTASDNEEEESAKVQVKIEKEDVVVNEEGTAVNEKAKVSAEDEKTAVNEEKIVKQEHKVESGTKKKDARKSWAEQRIADMYASSSSSKHGQSQIQGSVRV